MDSVTIEIELKRKSVVVETEDFPMTEPVAVQFKPASLVFNTVALLPVHQQQNKNKI